MRKGASCINAKSNEKGKRKTTIRFRLDYEINKLNSGNRTGSLRGNLIIEKKKNSRLLKYEGRISPKGRQKPNGMVTQNSFHKTSLSILSNLDASKAEIASINLSRDACQWNNFMI